MAKEESCGIHLANSGIVATFPIPSPTMKRELSSREIINHLRAEKAFLREEFGVLSIGLFGSYAKNLQTSDSDIDLLVELKEPRFEWLAGLQLYLEQKFVTKIELLRKGKNISDRFARRVEKEIIYA